MTTENTPARTEVLRRIRAALGEPTPEPAAVRGDWDAIPRHYRRSSELPRDAVLDMLEDRLRDYDAHVEHVHNANLAASIARLLATRNITRMVAPQGLREVLRQQFAQSLPESIEFIQDDGSLTYAELNAIPGVLTTAQLGIAATGTLVLQNVPGQGRRAATLIPDYHLCILQQTDVVETVPQAMDLLADTARLATTFISGPSATADIEMTRIKGVHGPRSLDVVLVS